MVSLSQYQSVESYLALYHGIGMKSLGNGRIVFVSSQVGQVVIHGFTAYGGSKWALRGFAEV